MTSALGRSHTFDARADGYARGEACGGVVLRGGASCEPAPRVRGSAVRQDGRSASLTAPSGQAQQGLLLAALADGGMAPAGLVLAQAHGTGTSLGDPIEAGSLRAAVVGSRPSSCIPLAVGSIKANIGHAEAAAGLAGLLHLFLGLVWSTTWPNTQLHVLNPFVKGAVTGSGCALPTQAGALPGGGDRPGGVSSFGYSGTIVHVLLRAEAGRLVVALPIRVHRRRAFPWCGASHLSAQPRLSSSEATVSRYPPARATARALTTISPDTQLMEAGVTSQQAVRLASRLREELGGSTPIAATLVFEYPSPRAIAGHLALQFADIPRKLHGVDAVSVFISGHVQDTTLSGAEPLLAMVDTQFGVRAEDALPASTFQQHFVLLHLLQPHVAAYSMPLLLELPQACTLPLVRLALQLLVRRHAVLRTFYALAGESGEIHQIVLPADGWVVPLEECSEADWASHSERMFAAPFALTSAPPIRALLMKSTVQHHARLLVVVDHVALDFASMLIVRRELHRTLEAASRGRAAELPALSLQYADFAVWQQRSSHGDAVALDWWRDKLHGSVQVLQLPTDRPRGPTVNAVSASTVVQIDPSLGSALVALCWGERVSTLVIPI